MLKYLLVVQDLQEELGNGENMILKHILNMKVHVKELLVRVISDEWKQSGEFFKKSCCISFEGYVKLV